MIDSFDWRTSAALLAIVACAALLIAWQKRTTPERGASWLAHSALSLELLGLALSVFWAVNAADGAILPIIFVGGWAGMLVSRAVSINAVVLSMQATPRKTGTALFALLCVLTGYAALYASGFFHAINAAESAASQRTEISRPVRILDEEIAAARMELQALAGYADGTRARIAHEENAQAQADYERRRTALSADLAAAQAALDACPPNYITKCITPNSKNVASLQAALNTLTPPEISSYAARYDQYKGLRQHVLDLEKQRASLGGGAGDGADAWLPEDRAIAWVTGLTPAQASRVKWLLFTLVFDLLSLALRITAALWAGTVTSVAAALHQFRSFMNAGLSPQEAGAIMAGNTVAGMRPAQVSVPSLNTGGYVLVDGIAEIHKGERVLTVEETAEYEAWLKQKAAMPKGNDSKAMPKGNDSKAMPKEGKAVGGVYACESCGADFTAKTVWHRFCKSCGAERKQGVMKAKAARRNNG